jgi:hypothetical protein
LRGECWRPGGGLAPAHALLFAIQYIADSLTKSEVLAIF